MMGCNGQLCVYYLLKNFGQSLAIANEVLVEGRNQDEGSSFEHKSEVEHIQKDLMSIRPISLVSN